MTRRAARITEDEVRRAVKAVLALGLPVARVSFDGDKVDVIIGESGERSARAVDVSTSPEDFTNLDDYRAWRERERARGA